MNKNFVRKDHCPHCQHPVNSAIDENNEDVKPSVGDICICIKCGEVSQFDQNMMMTPFNISKLDVEAVKDIRHKQYRIAHMHWKEANTQ